METSTINTNNNIPNLNNVSQNSASNVGSPIKNSVNSTSDTSSTILKSSIALSKGELAQNLKKVNDGVMITSLVDRGLAKQSEILNNIKDELTSKLQDYKIDIDKNQLKDDILSKLDKFNDITQNLKYNDNNLLDSSSNRLMEINTMSETIELNVPSTQEIGTELTTFISRAEFSSANLDSIVSKINSSLDKMDKFKEEFTQTQRLLVENAKNTIEQQSRESMSRS
ncbi:MAG: hypothetical protein PQJ44_04920, partial [Sphaerochaetaceae bacterium]|nr:hypothetical protein [Sphaerochaetaceae bacterium]